MGKGTPIQAQQAKWDRMNAKWVELRKQGLVPAKDAQEREQRLRESRLGKSVIHIDR